MHLKAWTLATPRQIYEKGSLESRLIMSGDPETQGHLFRSGTQPFFVSMWHGRHWSPQPMHGFSCEGIWWLGAASETEYVASAVRQTAPNRIALNRPFMMGSPSHCLLGSGVPTEPRTNVRASVWSSCQCLPHGSWSVRKRCLSSPLRTFVYLLSYRYNNRR